MTPSNGKYPVNNTGESTAEYNRMITEQMQTEEYERNSSMQNLSHRFPGSKMSKYDRLSYPNREFRAKHTDRKSDYYRFNILYNRLASHANAARAKTITY